MVARSATGRSARSRAGWGTCTSRSRGATTSATPSGARRSSAERLVSGPGRCILGGRRRGAVPRPEAPAASHLLRGLRRAREWRSRRGGRAGGEHARWIGRRRVRPAAQPQRRPHRGRGRRARASLPSGRALGEDRGHPDRALATAGVQLTKVESRPSRAGPWDYVFYLDFEADPQTSPAREALALMRTCCEWVQPLGTYRAATTVLEPD